MGQVFSNPYPSYVRMTDDSGATNQYFLNYCICPFDDTAECLGSDGSIRLLSIVMLLKVDLIWCTGDFLVYAGGYQYFIHESMQVHQWTRFSEK